MAVNLTKGQKVNLSKAVEKLANVTVGLGWDMAHNGRSIDCDSSVFVLREYTKHISKKVKSGLFGLFSKTETEETTECGLESSNDIVYYAHLAHNSGCINHRGDNLIGGSGKRNDDEQIAINLKEMPMDIKKLVVVVNIYDCRNREQHFGMIKNCYARIVDDATKEEICNYNLTDNYDKCTALIVGELYRDENNEWQFRAIGEGTHDGNISDIAKRYE
jgi:stress response protein SCP2